eukprot:scaffold75216_cov28-Tisochrysis_lutea.AAC.5
MNASSRVAGRVIEPDASGAPGSRKSGGDGSGSSFGGDGNHCAEAGAEVRSSSAEVGRFDMRGGRTRGRIGSNGLRGDTSCL